MNDASTTVQELKKQIAQFVHERDWEQFHSLKNLSMDISCEAGELMEKFLWIASQDSQKEMETNRQEIEDELADVLMGILAFANVANIDISKAFHHKLQETAKKYPIEKSKGVSTKYTKL